MLTKLGQVKHQTLDNSVEEARLLAESDARFLRGEYDDSFADGEHVVDQPPSSEMVAHALAIFEMHGHS